MSYGKESKRQGQDRGSYSGKCDVRLTKKEDDMLNILSDRNGVTRSTIMRKALRDFYKFNSDKEDETE